MLQKILVIDNVRYYLSEVVRVVTNKNRYKNYHKIVTIIIFNCDRLFEGCCEIIFLPRVLSVTIIKRPLLLFIY